VFNKAPKNFHHVLDRCGIVCASFCPTMIATPHLLDGEKGQLVRVASASLHRRAAATLVVADDAVFQRTKDRAGARVSVWANGVLHEPTKYVQNCRLPGHRAFAFLRAGR